ncbi:hypothetical protein E2C01_083831 [Portunus trituberculatus]|uniref:Uncharacterized protein n=1 Tax=Portunus trituberculatus TaxID=210409 RepID=A0A5B7J5V8_PORTR|nr:hypothetical protein [Portunus trituberculatus]
MSHHNIACLTLYFEYIRLAANKVCTSVSNYLSIYFHKCRSDGWLASRSFPYIFTLLHPSLGSSRHTDAGPAVHDRPDRGQQHGSGAQPDRHLLGLVGTDGRRQDGGRAAQRHHEGHRARRQRGTNPPPVINSLVGHGSGSLFSRPCT